MKLSILAEFGEFGGTRTALENTLSALSDSAYEVVFVYDSEEAVSGLKESQRMNEKIVWFRLPRFFSVIRVRLLRKFPFFLIHDFLLSVYVRWKIKPDLVLLSVGSPPIGSVFFFLFSKLVYVQHTYPEFVVRGVRLLGVWPFRVRLTKSRRILTVSEFSKRRIAETWRLENRQEYINVLPNPITNVDSGIRKKTRSDSNDKLSVYTFGHVEEYKSPFLWIEIAKSVSARIESEFFWFGEGSLLEECRLRTQGFSNIRFLGWRKNPISEVPEGSVYLQPSRIESQGISVLEAMAAKLPCVVSDQGGLPETVLDEVTGFVCPISSPDTFVEKLILLHNAPRLISSMGESGFKRVEKFYSRDRWKKDFLEYLDRLS
ncbi:glycosyltransferase [Leptospira gomenensis]|uniref:Glycosyltransferase n=1 Tax=Leptospira gomenensis TaxID=2484974 RepID=A0A5F1YRV8_9LEPT|nr:glycosyltransferase family 4 protein [Leptospira gomenensis]TGK30901.1 glycosyltransferase [Leptospira gomenensis]TGK32539.1 glycosyltransferase [Leptospira gomenensis]TGK45379.1 glycosyltransferase [Leptospira gomenensis]TGK60629.1 glycosyltransferase [Leptospira gomenensis]